MYIGSLYSILINYLVYNLTESQWYVKHFWEDIFSLEAFELIPTYWQHWTDHNTNHRAIEIDKRYDTFTTLKSTKFPILTMTHWLQWISQFDINMTFRILILLPIHWITLQLRHYSQAPNNCTPVGHFNVANMPVWVRISLEINIFQKFLARDVYIFPLPSFHFINERTQMQYSKINYYPSFSLSNKKTRTLRHWRQNFLVEQRCLKRNSCLLAVFVIFYI